MSTSQWAGNQTLVAQKPSVLPAKERPRLRTEP